MGWYLGCSSTFGSILWPPFASCHLGGTTLLMFSHLRLYINWKPEELLLPPPHIQKATTNNTMSGKSTKARRGKRKQPDWSVWKKKRVCHICGAVAGQKQRFHACNQKCGTLYCGGCFQPTSFTDNVVVICHGCKKKGCVGCINDTACVSCGVDYCSDCDDRTEVCQGCGETFCLDGDCYNAETGYCIGCDGGGPYPDPEEYNYN